MNDHYRPGDDQWSADAAARRLGLIQPEPRRSSGAYQTAVVSGDFIYLSGHGPATPGQPLPSGKLGDTVSLEEGRRAARIATGNLLNTLHHAVGSLDHVAHLLQLHVMVNATPSFTDHAAVADGGSDLLAEVFGNRCAHTRSAVGHSSLPFDIPVSVNMIARLSDHR